MQGKHQYEQQLFHYLDIASFIPQNHLLRKIDKMIDLSFVQELTKPFYCQSNGRPSIDPELFFRMILISYLYAIESNRQLCDEIQYNLAYRWFCKLNLEDKVPDHSSLTRIRDRFGLDVFNEFFLKIIDCCRSMGLVKGERIMTDGTLFEANASLDSLTLKETVKDKIAESTSNKPGVTPPVKRSVSNKTHISKTDPDATLAVKAGTPRTLKYKAHISIDADTRVILDAKITTGATHESQVYLEQLQTIENRLNINIRCAIADRAYGSGDIIQSLLDRRIIPNIALFSGRSGSSQDPEGLIYETEKNRYRCPTGKYLNPCPTIQNNTTIYLTKSSDCKACSYSELCPLKLKDKNKNIRIHTRHIHRDLFEKVKVWTAQEKFQDNLVERMWKMEGLISEAKNLHGLSRARYRGLKKTQIQAYMVASALNIKRLVATFYLLFLLLKYVNLYFKKFFIQFYATI